MEIQIIVDSCCDTTPALRRAMRFVIAPLTVSAGDASFCDDGHIEIPQLLAAMKATNQPAASACPSPESYAALMRAAEASVVVTLSSKLSGSYNAACVARDMVLEEYPEKKIHVLDSQSASAGELRQALLLRQLIDGGLSFEEVVEKAEVFADSMKTFFVLEDLSNLVKNGRISKVAGLMGTMLSIRPIMGENGHGEIIQLDKVRGTQNALRRLVEIVNNALASHPAKSLVLVLSHCNCPDRATALRESLLAGCAALREVIVVPTGGVSTVYANDGGVVLAV
ncbi:MAG TPA: DegV family protein [Candidatus Anaerofilum excrementigallinarum]|nr:DegV family protein [Candidatus Anaerofilum excrementigallinarum]